MTSTYNTTSWLQFYQAKCLKRKDDAYDSSMVFLIKITTFKEGSTIAVVIRQEQIKDSNFKALNILLWQKPTLIISQEHQPSWITSILIMLRNICKHDLFSIDMETSTHNKKLLEWDFVIIYDLSSYNPQTSGSNKAQSSQFYPS